MSEQKAKNKNSESGQRMRKWIWFVAILILTVAIGCYFLSKTYLLKFQTVDEQLAAIEAVHAIPDAENAALVYYEVIPEVVNAPHLRDLFGEETERVSRSEFLQSKDYPELTKWFQDNEQIISKVIQAAKVEKCRFPIIIDPEKEYIHNDRIRAMRNMFDLMVCAANFDIGEGRVDAGIEKYCCILQMGGHLRQQPDWFDFLVGTAIESVGLRQIASFIVKGSPAEKHFKIIETFKLETKYTWNVFSASVLEVEKLREKKRTVFFDFAVLFWRKAKEPDSSDQHCRRIYLRGLTARRGNRILIALRRYKNKHGRWPAQLDDIKPLVPAQMFLDPANGGSFVYRLTDENFVLYSKGENNIDESGKYWPSVDGEPDDWPIWPRTSISRKSKEENANAEQQ